MHISELADHKVENPEDIVKVGDEIEVKVLRVDADERKIGLSRKRVEWAEEAEAEAAKEEAKSGHESSQSIRPAELKGGVGRSSGPLIAPIPRREAAKSAEAEQSGRRRRAKQIRQNRKNARRRAVTLQVVAAFFDGRCDRR